MDALQLDITLPRRDFVAELSLAVGRETFALVGPSGSGKTSVLRAIAGLERPTRGSIELAGRPLYDGERRIDLPAETRDVGYVFQEYALFPHMTVARNIAFAGRDRVAELMDRLGIAHLADARPTELSGGERQRVALARALARRPRALLLDEPLAALDAHTRSTVRGELAYILGELGLPVLLVTHDFHDAVVLADRVGVIDRGRLVQTGAPSDVLAAPVDAFVASFTGANVVPGTARAGRAGLTEVTLVDGTRVFSIDPADGPVEVIVNPWDVAIGRGGSGDSAMNHISGPVRSLVRIGNRARVQIGPFVAEITAASADALGVRDGEVMAASFKAAATRLVRRRDPAGASTVLPAG